MLSGDQLGGGKRRGNPFEITIRSLDIHMP
jgi:hypothetical protein